MQDPSPKILDDVSPVAVKCGRIAFCFYGTVFLVIGGLAAYYDASKEAVLASTLIVTGAAIVVLGFILPRKWVAYLGILLPW
jgi:hypothetical protein